MTETRGIRRSRRLLHRCIAAAFGAAFLTGLAGAGEWTQFRGPAGQGVSPESQAPTQWSQSANLLWKAELPGPGSSSPIVAGNRLFVACYSGDANDAARRLVCLDPRTGKVAWARDVPSKLPEQAGIREGHGYASSTPAADGERVYAFFGKSGVFAFDHLGSQLWQADVGSRTSGWGSAASPVLAGDLVVVNASVESESLVALDRRTGKEVWRAGGIRESWNTPILVSVGDRTELAVAVLGKVLGFDPRTGRQLWKCMTDISWYMVPSLVADRDVVYCTGGRQGAALAVRAGGRGDVTQSHRLWTARKGSNVTSPVFWEGHLYWANENLGIAYCASAKTGEMVYEERLGGAGQIYASPVVAGGHLYYLTRSGRTYVLAAQPKFQQVAVNDLADRSPFNASPAIADGRLFVRSDKCLYCIGAR